MESFLSKTLASISYNRELLWKAAFVKNDLGPQKSGASSQIWC